MLQLKTVFCVIDPLTDNQRALVRAADIARGSKARLHMYVCMGPPAGVSGPQQEPALRAEAARYEAWMEQLAQPHVDKGLKVVTEVECKDDWRDAIAPAAKRANADLIVKGSFRRTALRRRLLKTGDWTLLRTAKVPVLLVKRDEVQRLQRVLVSLNLNAKDAKHEALTQAVIDYAKFAAKATGAELHAVNAYSDSLKFVHPPDLAKRLGIERGNAHVVQGSPDRVVTEVAEKLGNPLVIIGSLSRRGMGGVVVGNTAERILDSIESDVLVIVRPRSGS
jgi:universal stress protein E